MKNDFEMQIGDPGLTITTDDISASVGWEAFREFRETKNLFLLYQTPALVQILPKQAFTSDEQAHFREMAIQKVPLRLRSARAQTVRMIVFFAVVIVAFVLLFQTLRNIH